MTSPPRVARSGRAPQRGEEVSADRRPRARRGRARTRRPYGANRPTARRRRRAGRDRRLGSSRRAPPPGRCPAVNDEVETVEGAHRGGQIGAPESARRTRARPCGVVQDRLHGVAGVPPRRSRIVRGGGAVGMDSPTTPTMCDCVSTTWVRTSRAVQPSHGDAASQRSAGTASTRSVKAAASRRYRSGVDSVVIMRPILRPSRRCGLVRIGLRRRAPTRRRASREPRCRVVRSVSVMRFAGTPRQVAWSLKPASAARDARPRWRPARADAMKRCRRRIDRNVDGPYPNASLQPSVQLPTGHRRRVRQALHGPRADGERRRDPGRQRVRLVPRRQPAPAGVLQDRQPFRGVVRVLEPVHEHPFGRGTEHIRERDADVTDLCRRRPQYVRRRARAEPDAERLTAGGRVNDHADVSGPQTRTPTPAIHSTSTQPSGTSRCRPRRSRTMRTRVPRTGPVRRSSACTTP